MSLLFALFAAAPLCAVRTPEHGRLADARPKVLLAALNAAGYFYAITVLLQISGVAAQPREGAYALGLAAVYAGLGVALDRRAGDSPACTAARAPAADDALRVGDHVSDCGNCAPLASALDHAGLAGGGRAGLLGRSRERSTAG